LRTLEASSSEPTTAGNTRRFDTTEIHFENRVRMKEWVHESGTDTFGLHYDNITLELWAENDE
jgi:hypothetical protein